MDFISFGRAVGDPTRLEILRSLGSAGRSLEDIAVSTGIAKSTASYHVGILRAAGFVTRRRKGRKVIYSWSRNRWVLVDQGSRPGRTAIWNGIGT